MKLRCTENSIRLRFRKSELEELAAKERLLEHIQFGTGPTFFFGVELTEAQDLQAGFKDGRLMVALPKAQAMSWISTDQVGIESDPKEQVHILLEKDFPCKDRPNEDKSDTFTELAEQTAQKC